MLGTSLALVSLLLAAGPDDTLQEICKRHEARLPREFSKAMFLKRIRIACDKADFQPSSAVEAELADLGRQATDPADRAEAETCRQDSIRRRSDPKKPVRIDPGAHLRAWEAFYTNLFRNKAKRSTQLEALNYKLALYCSTERPEAAIALAEPLASAFYLSDALRVTQWEISNSAALGPLISDFGQSLSQRREQLVQLQASCPESPIEFQIEAFDRHIKAIALLKDSPADAKAEFLGAFCASGDRRQLSNAAYASVRAGCDAGVECLPRDLWALNDGGVIESSYVWIEQGLSATGVKDPVGLREYDATKAAWRQGDLELVSRSLRDYDLSIEVETPRDATANQLRYLVALVSDQASIPTIEAKRFEAAAAEAASRAAIPTCAGIVPKLTLPKGTCRAPIAANGPVCGPRQTVSDGSGVCCFSGMSITNLGECRGDCPSDLTPKGGGFCDCTDGKIMSPRLEYHCCWPGQTWNGKLSRCEERPQCDQRLFLVTPRACWPETFEVSIKRAECIARQGNWARSCFEVAEYHRLTRGQLDFDGYSAIADLYMKGCAGGDGDACWSGAQMTSRAAGFTGLLPRADAELELFERARQFYRELRGFGGQAQTPEKLAGVFGYSLFLVKRSDSDKERAQMLAGACLSSSNYGAAGAAVACEWLADYWGRTAATKAKALEVRRLICLHGAAGSWKGEVLPGTQEAVRRQCESMIRPDLAAGTADWEAVLRAALAALPNDGSWNGMSNRSLRNALSGQANGSDAWCGRAAGRPQNLSESYWATFRCWPKAAAGDTLKHCLQFESYGEKKHECPGRRGKPDEQLCCPLVAEPPADN